MLPQALMLAAACITVPLPTEAPDVVLPEEALHAVRPSPTDAMARTGNMARRNIRGAPTD
jgi:hypothetical protein